ncbi:hypothetical protein E3T24_05940 [Cryobacterium sp. TmT2-59]|uniref:hypothetical protein n=1 Tax=Cryobacterium sp. TmT2-59 TaxID=1259264 RepID=UPI00106A18FC|nr:hypothetical protein [Cryobacterium sp. TmT2-59]TFC86854.1 hypothetical protein E3T24_05940 [Cryobacterium sp. TmT2-59]
MAASLVDWASGDQGASFGEDELDGPLSAEPPHPINWNLLSADDAETAWIELNRWVNWLRRTYGLPASIVPPFWHRHPEVVWELSALHLHWLCAYDPDQHGSAPFGWHRDFADARQRLHDWVATSGTRLDRDRPSRQTVWPGEPPADAVDDIEISNRDEDFVQFVVDDVARRREAEAAFYARVESP